MLEAIEDLGRKRQEINGKKGIESAPTTGTKEAGERQRLLNEDGAPASS
jgi:hypothetical protein